MAGAKFTIDADSSKAQTALLSFEKKTKAIAKSIAKGFTERIGHKLFDGLASAAAKVPQFLGNAIDSASSMNEELGKSEAVFGSSSKMINDWSKKTADAFGISRLEALQATGTMGNMLKAFDVTGDQASGMAKHLVELAADMGSFNEASVEDTLFAIGAALRGENEPIRKFGVALDDARMKQEALSLGLYSGKGALSANAKAMASYSLIVKQTEIQQGNFKETSDDLANSKKRLVAQFKDLTAEVGKSLLPVVKDLISRLQEVDFEDVAQKISKVIKVIIDLVPTIIGVGIAIQGIKMAMFFKTMVTGLISATSLWGAQTKIIDLNTAAKIRNATAGGGAGAAAAGAGGAAAGAAGGVLSKIPQVLAVLATALIAFKGGEFIGKAIAGSMGSGGPTSIASDTPGEWDKKNEEEKDQKLKKENDDYRGVAKNRKMEADAANAKINQDREDKANKTAEEKKKIIKSITDEYKETLRILDARIKGDKKLLEQEKLRKEIQEEQKASASQGLMLGEKAAKEIVMKRRAANEAEKKREKDKIVDLEKKEKLKSDLGEDISESESKLDSAMGRSSVTAVSSMQSIGGGGGVAGELNLQKTQTSLQRELVGLQQQMVVLLEGVKTGVSQEHI
tara:strand:- start:37 stop:1911 length:1875 start_codon:yes stop_codon:yes gene_type:complete